MEIDCSACRNNSHVDATVREMNKIHLDKSKTNQQNLPATLHLFFHATWPNLTPRLIAALWSNAMHVRLIFPSDYFVFFSTVCLFVTCGSLDSGLKI